ncbi:MAG: ABC transporter substrate binding protein [Candidatus Competibacter sp.]|nr:ABC transporter substrate-binding protein [Candidatus Competibacteraceae bacterium]
MPFRTAVKVTNPHSWQGRIGATRYPSSKQCLWLLLGMLAVIGAAFSQTYEGKKILYINSYHVGYEGSDPITQGIEAVLKKYPIELQIIYMDTKRNPAEDFSQAAALKAKAVIEEFRPDVVIASDDNASKYLIMPYYKDAELPFVFCGVNWDASVYGFPYKNVTGMIEVALVSEIFRHLKKYAKGNRIGFIAGDTLSERKNLEYYIKRFDIEFSKIYFATTFEEWKQSYLKLQDEVDMAMMTSHVGIVDWNDQEARAFAENHVKIPIGTEHRWSIPFALVGVAKDFEEMGAWSAYAALKILDGVAPSKIPITANKKGQLLFNVRMAEKLGIDTVPPLAELVR